MKAVLWCMAVWLTFSPQGTAMAQGNKDSTTRAMLVVSGINENRIAENWITALQGRMNPQDIDSLAKLERQTTAEEKAWQRLIASRTATWTRIMDSIAGPFPGILQSDTIYILIGYGGVDDGFTYQHRTLCFDLTALQTSYGSAALPANSERMDRLFAHEFTHLLHKQWATEQA